jgi:hypothetical protein
MKFDLMKTTPFSVNEKEVLAFLQDPERFLRNSGGSDEDSVRYDENTELWHGES